MLHVVGFAFFTILLLVTVWGLAVMILASREKIEAVLRFGQPAMHRVNVEPSRVRVVRTVSHRRVMTPLRVAA